MSYQYRGFVVSDEMLESLTAYAERGRPVGDFLTAVLSNDLMEACGRADDFNLSNLPAFCAWVYNECPGPAHGSRQMVHDWIERHRRECDASVHDDKPDGRPDLHVSTEPGDLTTFGSPLRPGR